MEYHLSRRFRCLRGDPRCVRGQTKSNEKVVSRADILDRALLVPVFLGNVVLPGLYLFTPWLAFADYRLPSFLQCCGVLTMIVALWLFWRAHVDLGLNWSITLELRKKHELITNGVYRRIRHPMYAAIFLFAVAQGLVIAKLARGLGRVCDLWASVFNKGSSRGKDDGRGFWRIVSPLRWADGTAFAAAAKEG